MRSSTSITHKNITYVVILHNNKWYLVIEVYSFETFYIMVMKYLCLLLAYASDVIYLWFYTWNGLYTYGTICTLARFLLRGKIQTFSSHITLLPYFKLHIVCILEMGEEGEI